MARVALLLNILVAGVLMAMAPESGVAQSRETKAAWRHLIRESKFAGSERCSTHLPRRSQRRGPSLKGLVGCRPGRVRAWLS